jgi:hypothetical protein
MVEINVMTKSNFKIQTAFINEARVNALATLNELGYDANPNGHKGRIYSIEGVEVLFNERGALLFHVSQSKIDALLEGINDTTEHVYIVQYCEDEYEYLTYGYYSNIKAAKDAVLTLGLDPIHKDSKFSITKRVMWSK